MKIVLCCGLIFLISAFSVYGKNVPGTHDVKSIHAPLEEEMDLIKIILDVIVPYLPLFNTFILHAATLNADVGVTNVIVGTPKAVFTDGENGNTNFILTLEKLDLTLRYDIDLSILIDIKIPPATVNVTIEKIDIEGTVKLESGKLQDLVANIKLGKATFDGDGGNENIRSLMNDHFAEFINKYAESLSEIISPLVEFGINIALDKTTDENLQVAKLNSIFKDITSENLEDSIIIIIDNLISGKINIREINVKDLENTITPDIDYGYAIQVPHPVLSCSYDLSLNGGDSAWSLTANKTNVNIAQSNNFDIILTYEQLDIDNVKITSEKLTTFSLEGIFLNVKDITDDVNGYLNNNVEALFTTLSKSLTGLLHFPIEGITDVIKAIIYIVEQNNPEATTTENNSEPVTEEDSGSGASSNLISFSNVLVSYLVGLTWYLRNM